MAFRPHRMQRVLIAGAKPCLYETIEMLHRHRLVHIRDYAGSEDGFSIGAPLPAAHRASEQLLQIRAAMKVLGIDRGAAQEPWEEGELRMELDSRLARVQHSVTTKGEDNVRLETELRDLEKWSEDLTPLQRLPLDLSYYSGYRSLEVFVGFVRSDVSSAISAITPDYLLLTDPKAGVAAIFVPRVHAAEVSKVLQGAQFSELRIPKGERSPDRLLAEVQSQRAAAVERLGAARKELEALRKEHEGFLLAAEELLSIDVQKAESPLRFAVTKNAFLIEGFVKHADLPRLAGLLPAGAHLELLPLQDEPAGDEGAHHEPDPAEEPPVALRNPKVMRPVEFLMDLYSIPRYGEIDPTFLLALTFPFFFGMMIGDAGYGTLLILFGFYFLRGATDEEGQRFGKLLIGGGIWTLFFGIFVFAEAFGFEFTQYAEAFGMEVAHQYDVAYQGTLLFHYPMLFKLEVADVRFMLKFALVIGMIQIFIGFVIGFINEREHHPRHAAAKLAWLVVLVGLSLTLTTMVGMVRGDLFARPFALGEFAGIPLTGSLQIAIMIVLIGIVALVATSGFLEILEVLGLVTNLISYTRLAAIAVGKAALVLALNSLALSIIGIGGIPALIGGAIVLFVVQAMVFVLGALSSGIQAVRLHYVEWFLKFFKGGGRKFTPFGTTRRYTYAVGSG